MICIKTSIPNKFVRQTHQFCRTGTRFKSAVCLQEDAARRKRAEEEHKQAEAERKLQAERLQRDREELERREAEAQAERAREQARLEEEEEKRREAKAARLAAEAEKAEALLKEKKRAAEQAKAEAEQKEKERQERQPKKQRAAAASFAAAADAAAAAVTAAVAPERSLAVPAAQEPSSHPLPELPSGATPKATPDQTRLKEVVGLSSGSTNEVVSYQVAPGPGAARLLRVSSCHPVTRLISELTTVFQLLSTLYTLRPKPCSLQRRKLCTWECYTHPVRTAVFLRL